MYSLYDIVLTELVSHAPMSALKDSALRKAGRSGCGSGSSRESSRERESVREREREISDDMNDFYTLHATTNRILHEYTH